MKYPGKALRRGDSATALILAAQQRLSALEISPGVIDGIFGLITESAVKLFQTRYSLEPDGIIGPATWAALFNVALGSTQLPTTLQREIIRIAKAEVGVYEMSPNRGPRVDEYVRSVGLDPAGRYSWCAAFVYWCFREAGASKFIKKTGRVLELWDSAEAATKIAPDSDPSSIIPGSVFCTDHGHGKGHCGIVVGISTMLATVEGNTSVLGSRNGNGVYLRTRPLSQINLGYIDISRIT